MCFVSLSMLQTCMAFRGIKVLCDIFYIEKYFGEMNVRFYVGLSAFSSNFSQYIFSLLNHENTVIAFIPFLIFICICFAQNEKLPLIFLRCQPTRMKINKRELSQWVDGDTVDASKTHCHQKAISNSRI